MITITRGTTPYIEISLHGVDISEIANVWIDIEGKTSLRFSYSKGEIVIEEDKVKIHMSQEETLALNAGYASMGVRVLMNDGEALALAEVEEIKVKEVVGGGVISADN